MRRWSLVALGAVAFLLLAAPAQGHQDGCHAAHSCPSDASPPTYQCGDDGNPCQYDNNPSASSSGPFLHGPPTAEDCRDHAEYYTTSACAGLAPTTTTAPSATDAPAATAVPQESPRALNETGLETGVMGLSGLSLVEVGAGLMFVSSRRRRRAAPDPSQNTLINDDRPPLYAFLPRWRPY